MTSEEKVHYWLDIASYDIETAEAMCQTGRWLYVARYPEDKEALSSMLTPQTCRAIIDETKQLQQWIKEKL